MNRSKPKTDLEIKMFLHDLNALIVFYTYIAFVYSIEFVCCMFRSLLFWVLPAH